MGTLERGRGLIFDNWPPDNSGNADYRTWPPTPGLSASPGITPTQAVGPYSGIALPYGEGPFVAGPDRPGVLTLSGLVYDGAGQVVPDAALELWQADESGRLVTDGGIYAPVGPTGFRGFGRTEANAEGRYAFRTVKPGPVTDEDGPSGAPCIVLTLFAGGVLKMLVTRVYFADEPAANATDPFLGGVAEHRRPTLLARPVEDGYRFDIHLQGEEETVFLDVFERDRRPELS